MNRRERLERAYHYQEMDRPAFYTCAGYPPNDPTYDLLYAYLEAHTEQKLDWGGRLWASAYPLSRVVEPYSADFERHITLLHTPAGDLRATRLVGLKGQPGLNELHMINNREDAERYLSLPLPEPAGEVGPYFDALKRVGDSGIAEIRLGANPAGAIAALCGSTNFAMMSVTDRDILHALCAREAEAITRPIKLILSRIQAEKGRGASWPGLYFGILGQEYIVPPLHGPKDFADLNVRYDKPIFDLIHEAGGRVQVHCHSRIKQVIGGFLEMGTDVLHPFEAPPMGDITPAEAKQAVRGKICLEGNIQIARLYEATPEEVREEIAALIRVAFDDHRGLIISPAAWPYIVGKGEECFPRFKAMVDTVLEWKG
jgi:hypothetical protein